MLKLVFLFLITVPVFSFGQELLYSIAIDNFHVGKIDLSNQQVVKASFNLVFRNNSPDTAIYCGGQFFFNVPKAAFNNGTPCFDLQRSPLPARLLFNNVSAKVIGDSVLLFCMPKKPVEHGNGVLVMPGDSLIIGTFEISSSAQNGLDPEQFRLAIKHCLNSANPYSKVMLYKERKLIDISRECSYFFSPDF